MTRAADEPADVLVVGAGASGGVAALRLAEAGLSVVCLEQGRWHDRSEYPGATDDWELAARKQWASDPNVRGLPEDYPVDLSGSDMVTGMFNGVGGGTILYNAVWPRLSPDDFRVRSADGVADDWPIGYRDLLPYYEQTDRQFGVSGLGGNPAYPPGADPPHPPLPVGRAGMLVARAHARLGWHWWPDTNAILSVEAGGRHPCVQRGTCGSGCGEGAKSSTDLTHWPAVLARGGRLVTGATVTRVVVGRDGLAAGAEWVDEHGRGHFQAAGVVLLAANGIGSARLLLASAQDGFPDGLANRSGLVGRRLMLHPYAMVTGLFDQPLDSWQGHNGSAVGCWEHYPSDPRRGFVRGSKWSLHPTGGPLRVAAPAGGVGAWGPAHHDRVASHLGRTITWVCLCEDLPEDRNRVELSAEMTDRAGVPAPVVSYRRSANSDALLAWQSARAAESLTEAGAARVLSAVTTSNSHLLGTARMGDDPSTSVVDRYCMTHDVPNLGVIDGSVFVTAGAVNPTSTIAALALRAADRLATGRPDLRRRPGGARRRAPGAGAGARGAAPAAGAAPGAGARAARPAVDDRFRARFGALSDILVPGRDDRPWPSALHVAQRPLDGVLAARPDLTGPLARVLADDAAADAARAGAQQWMRALAGRDPEAGAAVALAVAGAYYRTPQAREAVGYPGQVARTLPRLDFPEYVAEGLLDPVVSSTRWTWEGAGWQAP